MVVYRLYLGHFIYVPIAFIFFLFVGEDFNTIVFGTILSMVTSAIIYIYHYVLYLILGRIADKHSIYCFLVPPVFLLIFFSSFQRMILSLDFGGEYFAQIIVVISLVVNLFAYYKLRRSKLLAKT